MSKKSSFLPPNQTWLLSNVAVFHVVSSGEDGRNGFGGPYAMEFAKGELIFQQNDPADSIYLLVDGRVKVGVQSSEGREIIKSIVVPGEIFGERVILGERLRKSYAVAMDPGVRVFAVGLEDLKAEMRLRPDLAMVICDLLSKRLSEAEARLDALVFKDARTRVVDFLRELGLRGRKGEEGSLRVVPFLTHREIASLTATSRQTVTSILNELRESGVISFDRKVLHIHDMAALSAG